MAEGETPAAGGNGKGLTKIVRLFSQDLTYPGVWESPGSDSDVGREKGEDQDRTLVLLCDTKALPSLDVPADLFPPLFVT